MATPLETLCLEDHHWSVQAKCHPDNKPAYHAEAFFPISRQWDWTSEVVIDEVCAECPVKKECLEEALSLPCLPMGVWGGLTEGEVQELWLRRHRQPGWRPRRRVGRLR
jgi:hypothetical protein